MKKRYDVPLGRVVWEVVEDAALQQDVLTSIHPSPPASGLSQSILLSTINSLAQQIDKVAFSSYVFRSSWAYYGPRDRKQYTTRAKAQVAAAKIVLAGGQAEVVEKRLNDFSGWKR